MPFLSRKQKCCSTEGNQENTLDSNYHPLTLSFLDPSTDMREGKPYLLCLSYAALKSLWSKWLFTPLPWLSESWHKGCGVPEVWSLWVFSSLVAAVLPCFRTTRQTTTAVLTRRCTQWRWTTRLILHLLLRSWQFQPRLRTVPVLKVSVAVCSYIIFTAVFQVTLGWLVLHLSSCTCARRQLGNQWHRCFSIAKYPSGLQTNSIGALKGTKKQSWLQQWNALPGLIFSSTFLCFEGCFPGEPGLASSSSAFFLRLIW